MYHPYKNKIDNNNNNKYFPYDALNKNLLNKDLLKIIRVIKIIRVKQKKLQNIYET